MSDSRSAWAGLPVLAFFNVLRELRDARVHSRTAGLQRRIADLEQTALPETIPMASP